MRFTITHLLLLFPAFFAACCLAAVIDFANIRFVTHKWQHALFDIERLENSIEMRAHPGTRPTVQNINDWLARENFQYRGEAAFDPWRRPYRCVEKKDATAKRFLIYSCGEDGLSKSNGNDPDDLNSWNPNPGRYYMLRRELQQRTAYVWEGLMYSPFVYVALLGSLRAWQWSVRRWARAFQSLPREGARA